VLPIVESSCDDVSIGRKIHGKNLVVDVAIYRSEQFSSGSETKLDFLSSGNVIDKVFSVGRENDLSCADCVGEFGSAGEVHGIIELENLAITSNSRV
jgi:hypothetical protein